jgi:post-segregation antitoxin (ccd killing protein)
VLAQQLVDALVERDQELQPLEVQLKQAEIQAKQREKLAPSVQEAIDFASLSPEMQGVFQNLQILKKPPAPVTRVTVNNMENTAAAELGKLVPDLYSQANAASSHLAQIPRYRSAVEKAVTGPLANQRLGAARVASMLGFSGDKALAATGELVQGLAEMTLQSRQMLQGQGQITEKEQELLQKARSGDINMSATELRTILAVSERAAKAQYAQSRKLLESAATRSPTAGIFLENLKPESPAPAPSVSQPAIAPGTKLPGGFTVKSVGQ